MLSKMTTLKVILTLAILSCVPLAFAPIAASAGGSAFKTFELGRFDSPGVSCPGSPTSCWNVNAEPQIRADRAGNFYAVSEFLPRITQCSNGLDLVNPQCGGTGAWKSSDNGLHYVTLRSPNSLSASCTPQTSPCTYASPYGGDTDVATAPKKNANGFYNVYVISLERASGPLLTVEESTSIDGGNTWTINPTSIQVPLNDRPWVAADGVSKVCVSVHNVATDFQILVSCSNNAGATFTQVTTAFDTAHLTWFTANTQIGSLAIDPGNHLVYQIFDSAVANENEALLCATVCSNSFHSVWVAVSIDGGASFIDYPVYINPSTSVGYNHQFSQVSVDKAGNVYAVYTDDHNTYYSYSTDFGKDWSGPIKVNGAPSSTAIFPWSAAGSAGQLDIVWYGTSYYDGVNSPDNYPMSAAWYVYFAQTHNALTTSPTFVQSAATGIIHYGGVCEAGVTCTGNRDLFDDFGVAASPTTGLASIVFSDDQYLNTASEPPSPTCTPDKTNTGSCDHTDIATQTSGTGIFQNHRGFEIEHEEMTVESDGQHADNKIEVQNTGSSAITSLTVSLAGTMLPSFSWDTTMPLQPGSIASGSSTVSLQSLLLTSGSVYPVSITATFADGTSVTQTVSVILTLYTL
jgi:hypothetical protein